MSTLLSVHIASCCFMTGAIWLVQIILYPLFGFITEAEFAKIHEFHMRRITPIVAPIMLLELLTAIGLLFQGRDLQNHFVQSHTFQNHESFYLWNLITVVMLWLLTAFVNVPTHNRLRFNSSRTKRDLVLLNWPRTIVWSLRTLGLLVFVILPSLEGVL